ncbi:MAG: preprotein translocase subunit SecA [Bacteroidota bacterium]
MLTFFTKLFGTKSERDLKKLQPYVERINTAFQQMQALSHDELREKTQAIKRHIQSELQEITRQTNTLKQEVENNVSLGLADTEQRYQQIHKLEKDYIQRLEAVLAEALPEAFALVKETARRFKENQQLVVTARDHDRAIAAAHTYVTIEGGQATWHNQWEVVGHPTTWDMVHYDEQLIGGIILHQGRIAEMATGEGKTLVATLPAFLNALAGKGVHIVTVNDYLAKRDAAWMGPIYAFHGLSVSCIDEHPPHSLARHAAYRADITYSTNNELGFDYLRDNMATRAEDLVQRGHHFAIIDEVDSVLIDDARTPLIISGPVEEDTEQTYVTLNPRVQQLTEAQRLLVTQYLQEAKNKLAVDDTQAGSLALFRAYRGLPKYKPLIQYLSEPGIKQLLHQTENYYIQDSERMMPEADKPLLFTIDERNNSIELTEKGLERITQQGEDPHFFVLPDVGLAISQVENDPQLEEQAKLAKKDALIQEYATKSQRIHTIQQLLKAYTLFEKDIDYIVIDGRVKIVDEQTGRVLAGRRYADGLHQALEAKEKVKIEKASQTYATITLQNYFRMYHKLAGMTGTAVTEASEFWDIYRLDVVVTPTHRPAIRDDKEDKVYKTAREKFQAAIEEITTLAKQDRPVLVGTTSVEVSEYVSKMLSRRKIKHQVLNAKHHQKEAEIIAEAGKAGTVTIATNMAGRGTDIKLTPQARAAGGLAIIGTERHESRRVDRQLRGRAGRQGDVGSSQFFVSLEDHLMRLFIPDRIAKVMDRLGLQEGEVIQHSMVTKSIERAQKKVEQNNYVIRKRLLEYDNEINKQREVVYQRRKDALFESKLRLYIMGMLYKVADQLTATVGHTNNYKSLEATLLREFGIHSQIPAEALESKRAEEKTSLVYQTLLEAYRENYQFLCRTGNDMLNETDPIRTAEDRIIAVFTNGQQILEAAISPEAATRTAGGAFATGLAKTAIIAFIDQYWQEHLRNMDELRHSVQNAVYEQKDPLLIYKFEAYTLFNKFIHKVNRAIVSYLLRATLQACKISTTEPPSQRSKPTLQEGKQDMLSLSHANPATSPDDRPKAKIQPLKSQKITGRNRRVTVQYQDGTVRENIKLKNVEEDLANKQCVLIAAK